VTTEANIVMGLPDTKQISLMTPEWAMWVVINEEEAQMLAQAVAAEVGGEAAGEGRGGTMEAVSVQGFVNANSVIHEYTEVEAGVLR
jgi:type 1 glutamine amidotransferase